MQAPPAQVEAALIGPTSELVHRIEIYHADGTTRWLDGDNDDCLIEGSVSIDYSRSERRAFDIRLDNTDFKLEHTPGKFWYDKILKIFSGVKYIDTTPVVSTTVRTNLCTNPSFEVNIAPWWGSVIGSTDPTMTRDTGTAYRGSACMKIVWPTASWSAMRYDLAGIPVGTVITVTARIFVPTGQPNVKWGMIFGPDTTVTVKNQWAEASVTLTTTSDPVYIGVNTTGATTAGEYCYLDAVMFEISPTNKGYFDGSTLDFGNYDFAWTGTANASTSTQTITSYTPAATPKIWEVQVGEFMIDNISEAHFPQVVSVTGRDYTKKCLVSKFTTATAYTQGTTIEAAIKAIAQAAGVTKFVLPVTGKTLGTDYYFERGMERWQAMSDIASAFGYELFFNPIGELVLREVADPVTSPLRYTLSTGYTDPDGSTLAGYEKSLNDTRLYNHIVVTGESTEADIPPVAAEAVNTEPSSPTRVSEIGDRVYQYTSSFITTVAQAQDVADKFLKIHSLEEFDLNFSIISLPWLDAGEIIEFEDPRPSAGQPTRFLLSSLALPLGLGPMTGNAKRVSVVG